MRVLIATGGTGGHIYPGIAIARSFQEKDPATRIKFVGARQGIENKIIPREGFSLETVNVGGIKGKSFLKKLSGFIRLPGVFFECLKIIISEKPDLVIGLGGFTSGPVVFTAWILRIPTLIQEQNVFPGITNRILGRLVKKIAVSFKESARFFPEKKIVVTGNPIRKEFIQEGEMSTILDMPGKESFCILVFGGSQGSHRINEVMLEAVDFLEDLKELIYIVHQTGERDFPMIKEGYENKGFPAEVKPFIYDMGRVYKRADLVISRAGATTLAELAVCGKSSILIPYPHATNNHQELNAIAIRDQGAAEMIPERELTGKKISERIKFLFRNREYLKEMGAKSRLLGNPLAADNVVRIGYDLMHERSVQTH